MGKRQRRRQREAEHAVAGLAKAAKRLDDANDVQARARARFRLVVRLAYHHEQMSQTDIARVTGRTQQAISRWVAE